MKDRENQKPDAEIERWREYMCAHFQNCKGCPLGEAAQKAKMKCSAFRRRRPDETEMIVRTWKHGISPETCD